MMRAANLYVHFPFCRSKCAYCALHSRAGASISERDGYAEKIAFAVSRLPRQKFSTVYFGGGTPALCNLSPVFTALQPFIEEDETEFTVELNPRDVEANLLEKLRSGGVNRISMGVQSLEDETLKRMGRGYCVEDAERAFELIKSRFDNAGIDLIAGYPRTEPEEKTESLIEKSSRFLNLGVVHCSVYHLMLEPGTALEKSGVEIPSDDRAFEESYAIEEVLSTFGLRRYEISNYAVPGMECRHNMSVWRGEDYIGLGDGAYGRIGNLRTTGWPEWNFTGSRLDWSEDEMERRIFRLRTIEGLDASGKTEWIEKLDWYAKEGLLEKDGTTYRLTRRGAEVCDSILAALV